MKRVLLTLHAVALKTGKGDSVASQDDITLQVSSQPWRALKKQPGHLLVPSVVSTDVHWRGDTTPHPLVSIVDILTG